MSLNSDKNFQPTNGSNSDDRKEPMIQMKTYSDKYLKHHRAKNNKEWLADVSNNNRIHANESSNSIQLTEVTVCDGFCWPIGTRRVYFQSLNLSISHGQIFAVIGGQRTGKTRLLETIAKIRLPTSGHVSHWKGVNRSICKSKRKLSIGFMPQHQGFVEQLTVAENMHLMGRMFGLKATLINQKLHRLLEIIGLQKENQVIYGMNRLQQSLIALALASLHSPSILILDEPDFGPDLILKEQVWRQLKCLTKEKNVTIIFSTTITEDCRFSDEAAIIERLQLHPYKLHIERIEQESNDNNIISQDKLDIYSLMAINVDKIRNFGRHCYMVKMNDEPFERKIDEQDDQPEERYIESQNECMEHIHYESNSTNRFFSIFCLMVTLFIRKQAKLTLVQLILPSILVTIGYYLLGNNPHQIKVAVYNPDMPPVVSKHVLNMLDIYTIQLVHYSNLEVAIQAVRDGQTWAVIEFPSNYTNSIFNYALQNCDDGSENEPEEGNYLVMSNETVMEKKISQPIAESDHDIKINMVTIRMHVDNSNLLVSAFIKAKVLQALERAHHDAQENQLDTIMTQPLIIVTPNVYGSEDTPMKDFLLPGIIMLVMYFCSSILPLAELLYLLKAPMFCTTMVIAKVNRWLLLIQWVTLKFIILTIQIMLLMMTLVYLLNIQYVPTGMFLFVTLTVIQAIFVLMCTLLIVLLSSASLTITLFVHWINFILMCLIGGLLWPLECLPPFIRKIMLYCYPQSSIAEAMRSAMSRGWSFDRYLNNQSNNIVWLSINVTLIWMTSILLLIILIDKYKH